MKDMKYYIDLEQAIYTNILAQADQLLAKILNAQFDFSEVVIYATGSSANAAYGASVYLAKCLQVPVHVKEPSIDANYMLYLKKDVLYLAISQGGHSYSILEMIENAQKAKVNIFVITSDPKSPVAKKSKNVILMGIPIEEMPYVTAGYSATILLLDLLALKLGLKKQTLTFEDYQEQLQQIKCIIKNLSAVIKRSQIWLTENMPIFKQAKRMIFIGYGATYGIAREGETKITETTHITALGKELEEYMHGPYLGLHEDDCIIFLEPNGKLKERATNLKKFLNLHVNDVLTIYTTKGTKKTDLNLQITGINECLAALYMTIPLHLLAYELAKIKEIDLTCTTYREFDQITGSKI